MKNVSAETKSKNNRAIRQSLVVLLDIKNRVEKELPGATFTFYNKGGYTSELTIKYDDLSLRVKAELGSSSNYFWRLSYDYSKIRVSFYDVTYKTKSFKVLDKTLMVGDMCIQRIVECFAGRIEKHQLEQKAVKNSAFANATIRQHFGKNHICGDFGDFYIQDSSNASSCLVEVCFSGKYGLFGVGGFPADTHVVIKRVYQLEEGIQSLKDLLFMDKRQR